MIKENKSNGSTQVQVLSIVLEVTIICYNINVMPDTATKLETSVGDNSLLFRTITKQSDLDQKDLTVLKIWKKINGKWISTPKILGYKISQKKRQVRHRTYELNGYALKTVDASKCLKVTTSHYLTSLGFIFKNLKVCTRPVLYRRLHVYPWKDLQSICMVQYSTNKPK